jgi:hypothetical protein
VDFPKIEVLFREIMFPKSKDRHSDDPPGISVRPSVLHFSTRYLVLSVNLKEAAECI